MSHKNGDVTVVTHVSQCHHHDQGLVIPSISSCLPHHTLYPAEILCFTLSSSIIHHLWLILVLLKVTISFALFLPTLSKFSSVSHLVTCPSSCKSCHNFASLLPFPFLFYFSLWLNLVLLKVTISSFRFVSCVLHHTRPHHTPSHHQHHPIPLFLPFSYFTFRPTSFCTYLIWHISTSLTLWLGHT